MQGTLSSAAGSATLCLSSTCLTVVKVCSKSPFLWGKDYMVATEYYSQWLEIIQLHNMTAAVVISKLKHIFAAHRISNTVVFDNDWQFQCKEFWDFAHKFDFKRQTGSPAFPQATGIAESRVKLQRDLSPGISKCDSPELAGNTTLQHRRQSSRGVDGETGENKTPNARALQWQRHTGKVHGTKKGRLSQLILKTALILLALQLGFCVGRGSISRSSLCLARSSTAITAASGSQGVGDSKVIMGLPCFKSSFHTYYDYLKSNNTQAARGCIAQGPSHFREEKEIHMHCCQKLYAVSTLCVAHELVQFPSSL